MSSPSDRSWPRVGARRPKLGPFLLRSAVCVPAALLIMSPTKPSTAPLDEWIAVTDRSLEIEHGSPLDFSAITPVLPNARMTIAGDKLTFNGTPLPINCATLAPGFSETPRSGFPDHNTARRYAIQLRRHGYNLVRFHFIDALLMRGSRQDLTFNPEELDRFQFFVAELRKQNIHWLVDILASDNAALGNIFPHRWSAKRGMIVNTLLKSAAMRHWQGLAERLLTTPNPYTGLALATDSHTAGLILINEPNLDFRLEVANKFKPEPIPEPYLSAFLRSGGRNETLPIPASSQEISPAMERLQHFFSDRQRSALVEMATTIRHLGYNGPYSSFDAWKRYNQIPTLHMLPMIAMHGYQNDQVAGGVDPGQRIKSSSSFDEQARYLQLMGSVRFFGKPLIVTEHDQVFWNKNRFESGLFAPTFASLQGWNFICRHSDGPIDLAYDGRGLRKQAIEPDGGGLDPVTRASETLTALLWLRREIAPATGAIRFRISDRNALRDGGKGQLPGDLGMLGWIARLGIADDIAPSLGVDQSLAMDLALDSQSSQISIRTRKLVAALRAIGALPQGNATDPAQGRWTSPDGQVSLDIKARQLRVSTRFTSAIASTQIDTPVTVGSVRFLKSDTPALAALSSLDGKPLSTSRKILIILASDARNSGMDVDEFGYLKALGKLPVQLRRVRLRATLQTAGTGEWWLVPLSLSGARRGDRRLIPGLGGLEVGLDTAMSAAGPTTYFLLERR